MYFSVGSLGHFVVVVEFARYVYSASPVVISLSRGVVGGGGVVMVGLSALTVGMILVLVGGGVESGDRGVGVVVDPSGSGVGDDFWRIVAGGDLVSWPVGDHGWFGSVVVSDDGNVVVTVGPLNLVIFAVAGSVVGVAVGYRGVAHDWVAG